MENNKDNSCGLGCLVLIVIAILWEIVRTIIVLFDEKPDLMTKIGIGIAILIFWGILRKVTKKSREEKQKFDKKYKYFIEIEANEKITKAKTEIDSLTKDLDELSKKNDKL